MIFGPIKLTITLTLLAAGIVLISQTIAAATPALGPPPYFQKPPLSSNIDLGVRPTIPAGNAAYYSYLPFIRRDRIGLVVNPQARQASLDFYLAYYPPPGGVSINWTGNHAFCNPGTTDRNFREAVLRRLNYFRAMAGIPADIIFSDDSNRTAQAAALMMSVNRQLNHNPPVSWTCYSYDGFLGANTSNLAFGMNGWDAITAYMRDAGGQNYFVGHRRWVLEPSTRTTGIGDIPPTPDYPATNALRVFDPQYWPGWTREAFVSWPPPGYVPYTVVFPRWSFSCLQADFSGATVTLESRGAPVPLIQAPVLDGYGYNTLVWIPLGLNDGDAWPRPLEDTAYTVRIHHVLINGQPRDFTYQVTVFDPLP